MGSGSGSGSSPPDRRAGRLRRSLALAALAGLVTLAAAGGAVGWLGWTEAGLRAALRLAQWAAAGELEVKGVAGRLVGPFSAEEIHLRTPDLRVGIRDLRVAWRPWALMAAQLQVDSVAAEAVELATRPTDDAGPAPTPPEDLELPFAVAVERVTVGRIAVLEWAEDAADLAGDARAGSQSGADPAPFMVSELHARVASDGRRHRLPMLAAALPFGRAALAGEIDGRTPFALSARGAMQGEHEGRPWHVDLTAEGGLIAPRIAAAAHGAGLTGNVEVQALPFAPIPLGRLRIAVDGLDPSAFVAGAPRAELAIDADLAPVSATEWDLAGTVRVTNGRPDTVDRGGLPLQGFSAQLALTPARVALDELDVRLRGKGRLGGTLAWALPGAAAAAGPVQDGSSRPSPEDKPPAEGNQAGAPSFGRLTAALRLTGVTARDLDGRLPAVALSGKLDAAADDLRQTLAVDLRTGAARLAARGELDVAAVGEARPFVMSATLSRFDPRQVFADAPAARLNLELQAKGRVGATPSAELVFRIPASELKGLALSGDGRLTLEPARLSGADLRFELGGNRASAEGAWGAAEDRLALMIDAPRLDEIDAAVRGRLSLHGVLAGTPAEPAGDVRFHAQGLVLPGGVRIGGVNGEAALASGLDGPVRLAVGLSGLGAADRDDADWVERGRVTIDGTRSAHVIEIGAEGLQSDHIELRLEGGLVDAGEDVQASPLWQGRLVALQTAGRFPAQLRAPAEIGVGVGGFRLGPAELEAGERGRIVLEETRWTPEEAALRGRLSGLAFGLVAQPEGTRRRGPGPLQLGAEWDVRLGATVDGEARLFREAGDLVVSGEIPARLGLEHFETRVAARAGRLALSLAARGSELGELSGAFSATAERSPEGGWRLAPDEALLGSAQLSMPSVAWLGRLLQENVDTAGSLQATLSVSGSPAQPNAAGRIFGRELSVVLADQGLHLSGGELAAEFDRDRLRLTRLGFTSPNRVRPRDGRVPVAALTKTPGTLDASGEIALDSGRGRFRFAADRLPLLQRQDRWLIVSGEGALRSTWTSAELNASLRADAGYVELAETPPPSLSDDVVVLGREPAGTGGGFAIAADVRLGLGDHLYLSALGVDTRLAGDVRLRMVPGRPLTASGAISTAGGTFRGYGQQLAIERGLITFQGPLDNPGLNVVALRKGLEVEAGLAIVGSARRPRIQLVSEPPVPDPEKLSWIVLGRAPDAGAGADLGLLLPAAQALLGGPGGGITDQMSRSLGLDQLSIGQGDLNSATRTATSRVVGSGSTVGTEGSVSGQVLSLGKRLSTDLFLSFEQSLAGAESLVKLTYQLGRRVSLVARGGTDNAVDVYYTFSFR